VWAGKFEYCPRGVARTARLRGDLSTPAERTFGEIDLVPGGRLHYQAFVTKFALRPLNHWGLYNQRARAEVIIGKLNHTSALGKIPTDSFPTNEAFFYYIVMLACSLLKLVQSSLRSAPFAGLLFIASTSVCPWCPRHWSDRVGFPLRACY
jgi:hypothetical protein